MEVEVKDGQTLADIAIQETGTADTVMDMARLNGISPAAKLEAGRRLLLPEVPNKRMQTYSKTNDVSPACSLPKETEQRHGGISEMCVGVDFEIL